MQIKGSYLYPIILAVLLHGIALSVNFLETEGKKQLRPIEVMVTIDPAPLNPIKKKSSVASKVTETAVPQKNQTPTPKPLPKQDLKKNLPEKKKEKKGKKNQSRPDLPDRNTGEKKREPEHLSSPSVSDLVPHLTPQANLKKKRGQTKPKAKVQTNTDHIKTDTSTPPRVDANLPLADKKPMPAHSIQKFESQNTTMGKKQVLEPVTPKTTAPAFRSNPRPRYPTMAKRRGYQGKVVLYVLVDPKGKPKQVRVKRSSGHASLDRAALKAVQTWEFFPGTKNDQPVEMGVDIPVVFKLE